MMIKYRPRIDALFKSRMEKLKENCQAECPVGDRTYIDEEGDHPGALRDSHEVVRAALFMWKMVVNARYGLHVYEGNGPEGSRPPNRWINRGLDRTAAESRSS